MTADVLQSFIATLNHLTPATQERAQAVLASFLAVVISMETTIGACLIAGMTCYALAGIALPPRS